jgi:serine/threonine-protein kinase HipA
MISERSRDPREAYVWVWLPDATEPVVAGRVETTSDLLMFNYGESYLGRSDAVPLYLPELPLRKGRIDPPGNLTVPGCIADAMPDAWGRRVIVQSLLGAGTASQDPDIIGPLTYLLTSGSDRIGALDFQASATHYERRNGGAPLDELMRAATLVDEGQPLSPALDQALLHGSSVGGARPKALLEAEGRKLIAKFSSATDHYPVVKGEYVAMKLAQLAGLDVAPVRIVKALGRDVLLVERFDRRITPQGETRRALVSALTMLELNEMEARYASYADLAQIIRERFREAKSTLRELFSRIIFNVLVGNTDDHARNHAAFWDGHTLELAPAYDICPQPRSGGVASQAMIIGPNGFRMSQLSGCLAAAPTYLLRREEAKEIIDHQIEAVRSNWADVCDLAGLTQAERDYFWGRQFLNRYAFEDVLGR